MDNEAEEPKTPPTREQVFATLDANLQDLLSRPVICDHPEWREHISAFAKQYADILMVQGELNQRYKQLREEERKGNTSDIQQKRLQTESDLRVTAHLGALNEQVKKTFLTQPEWLGDYIHEFLIPQREPGLQPDDAIDREKAAEKLLGSIVKCALVTTRQHYPGLVVPDECRGWVAYRPLLHFQERLALANKASSSGPAKE